MADDLVLFDLPGQQGSCWSPNTWKVRAYLNYKKIPYRTEWIEYPDIEPKCKELGIPANPPDDFAPYTVPFVKFPDGSYLMDSLTIVKRLEAEHPEPALPLETELAKAVSAANSKVVAPLWAILLAGIRRGVVSPGSDEWFKKDRERRMGQPEEVFASEQAKAQAFKAAEPRQAEVAAFLEQCKKDDGPFLRGSQVSYADFGVAGWVEMLSLIGGDLYQKCIVEIPGMLEVRQACQPWFERKGE